MNVTGIPFVLSIPTSEEIVAITVDGSSVKYTIHIFDETKIIKFYGTSNHSIVRISTKSHQYETNISKKQVKIAILETEYNSIQVTYWEQFIKDFIGIVPVRLNNSLNSNYIANDYTLIIAPNVVNLTDSMIDDLKKAVKNGSGLIVTSKFPNCNMFGFSIDEKKIPNVADLIIDKEHIAMMPFSKNEYISIDGEALSITNKSSTVLASIVCRNKENSLNNTERIKRYVSGLLIYFGFEFDLLKLQYDFLTKVNSLRKIPAVLTNRFYEGKIIYLSFDPVCMSGSDSRIDQGVNKLSKNSNLLHLARSAIIHASNSIFSKGLYKEEKVPIIYSIDTEASLSYYNASKKKCSHCELYGGGTDCEDTKMDKCLLKAAERLENFGAIGTFHIDTGGIYDINDQDAIKYVSKKHDISLHMGGNGDHSIWKKEVENDKYIMENLSNGKSILESIIQKQIFGIRYPGWIRTPSTHDILQELRLGYDTSSFAHPQYASLPFRMYRYSRNEPLDLWELPCIEVLEVVKHKPDDVKSKIRKKIAIHGIKQYVKQSYKHKGLIVLADHDMSIGTNPEHIHGTWQFDIIAFAEMMNYSYDFKRFEDLWVVTGSEFIKWYSYVRNLTFKEFKIIKKGNMREYIVRIDNKK